MSLRDEWGRDPSVQGMRRIFSRMEAIQKELLDQSILSRFDGRLRVWREEARKLFEKTWLRATEDGLRIDEDGVARLYAQCLVRVLKKSGIDTCSAVPAGDDKTIQYLDEDFR